jgi:hypothetical protein
LLVAHPVKAEKDAAGNRTMPDFYSVKGGGEFYDMSPHGLSIHRHFDYDYIEVKVLKVKFRNLGTNGASCYFAWNVNNGRYTPIYDIENYKLTREIEFDNSFWLDDNSKQSSFEDFVKSKEKHFDPNEGMIPNTYESLIDQNDHDLF